MRSYAVVSLLAAAVSATSHYPAPAEVAPAVQPEAAPAYPDPAHAAPTAMVMAATEVAPPAGAFTHTVIVGGVNPPAPEATAPAPKLLYSPESIKANVGDVVEFMFMQANHTVTESTFDTPCVKKQGGWDSEFMANPEGRADVKMQMTVSTADPLWFYCKQRTGNHCGKGMVFSINAVDSGEKSFAKFKELAVAQNGTAPATAGLQATPAAPPPAASTVTINAEGAAATGAAAEATVVPGHGEAADGSSCSCSCLCGANSFPGEAAVNNFGGWAGQMPPAPK